MPEGCSKYQSMSGAYPRNGFASLDEAVKEGRWIIFVGHDIGKRGYWVTAALEALCESLQGPAHGIWLGTVAEIAEYIRKQRGTTQGSVGGADQDEEHSPLRCAALERGCWRESHRREGFRVNLHPDAVKPLPV